jgi:carbon-monoxide dehydrogenase medium subunit
MRYEAPETLDAAVALLAGEPGETRLLAGGTDLLVQLKTDLVEPELVVDIKSIREVRTIKREAGGFRIGAAVTAAELSEHAELKQAWPGVVEAANLIGSTQIQGRATMGGNLCNGSPAADSVPALIAPGRTGAATLPLKTSWLGRAGWRSPGTSSSSPSFCHLAPTARGTLTCGSFRAQKWTSRWWGPVSI